MDLDTEIIEYSYKGTNYRLQLWKGTYAFGNAYGGEVGLYENTDGGAWYATVDGEHEIRTSQKIYDNKTSPENPLLENDVASYIDDQTHFWNLAIRTDSGYVKDSLHQETTLYIDNPEYRRQVVLAVNEYSETHENITWIEKENTVIINYR